MNRPAPDPSQEGNKHSSTSTLFPSWEGLGVGSWSHCMRKCERSTLAREARPALARPVRPPGTVKAPSPLRFVHPPSVLRSSPATEDGEDGPAHSKGPARRLSGGRFRNFSL